MDSRESDSPLPIALQQQIDEICDRFERSWQSGQSPRMADYLREVPTDGRPVLLGELIAIELQYAPIEPGKAIDAHALALRHPEIAVELRQQLNQLPPLQPQAPSRNDELQTAVATQRLSGSQGLHIRCPHCQVALELLADSPLDKINCRSCGSNFSLIDGEDDAIESRAPRQVGRFQLQERIGVGGFGSVWRAHDADLDRAVAIKIPRKGQLTASEMELFFREARAAAQLRHPNIVPVHEVGRDGDKIFIVSDLILGESLASWLKEQSPSTREMSELLATAADALHYAHEHGVVHRDFKPSNVMIDQKGAPHLMDFGLAKREVGEVTMTIDGHIVGTPAYMSPEQASGGTHWVDRRTDVYSLGVVLFEVLTGELPFRGNAQMQIRERLTADAPNPRHLNQKAPVDLSTICLKCLEREPNRRYSTAREMSEELRRYLRGEPIAARPISRTDRLIRWARRNPAPAAAVLLAAILAVAGPAAAIVINAQRVTISGRLEEIERLVNDYEGKLGDQAEKSEALVNELKSVLKIAPSDEQSTPAYQLALVDNLLKTRGDQLNATLASESVPAATKARGYLALAYLQAELNERGAAGEQVQRAIRELKQLETAEPDNLAWGVALGECYQLLREMDGAEHANVDTGQAAIVRHAYELLSNVNQSKSVSSLRQLSSGVATNWPVDPDDIYELACYLTQRTATLATEKDAASVKASSD